MPAGSGNDPLTRLDRLGLGLLALLVVGFGVMVEIRSAFQASRKTDFGVYARAAWAVRTGADPYQVIDDNGWHYCYPPAFAVAMAPLADPYRWLPREGYLPYPVSVGLWYGFGIVCVGFTAHAFAQVVVPDARRGSRRWWNARTVPVLVCLGAVGHTLARGQVNLLVTALVAGMFARNIRGQRVASGVWLAAAAALKVIPGFLVLFPLLRKDPRSLMGLTFGLIVLLGVVPALVWGPAGAVAMNRKVLDLVIAPGGDPGGGDQTRAEELTNTTATDSQSFQSAIHFLRHLGEDNPPAAEASTRLAHLAIGGTLTLLVLAVARRRPPGSPGDQLIFLGCLCVLMAHLTPVSHMHYYAYALPLVAGLWLKSLAERPGAAIADRRTFLVLAAWGIATAIPLFPGDTMYALRVGGFGPLATMLLMGEGLRSMSQNSAVANSGISLPVARAA